MIQYDLRCSVKSGSDTMSKGDSQLLFFLAHFCVYFILIMIFLKLSFNEHRLFAFRFLRRLIQRSCEPEVANSNIALLIDQDIGRLDIPMKYLTIMHILYGMEKVPYEYLNMIKLKCHATAFYQFFQISFTVFEYDIDFIECFSICWFDDV